LAVVKPDIPPIGGLGVVLAGSWAERTLKQLEIFAAHRPVRFIDLHDASAHRLMKQQTHLRFGLGLQNTDQVGIGRSPADAPIAGRSRRVRRAPRLEEVTHPTQFAKPQSEVGDRKCGSRGPLHDQTPDFSFWDVAADRFF
jgi:hypothetical protein